MNIDKHVQYTLEEKTPLKDIDSIGFVLRHNKSGARIILIENDDTNKTFCVGFRTPPADDTGVAHITEHSVLCGSKKFPVKDPFMELVKGSLNTFLNAMTYPDKTIYPVASTNDKDFKNLVDIYMDAVFHPNIYTRKEIFNQEGITLSLKDKDSDLIYNGVVYNEMKGAFSAPDDVLERAIMNSLYPNTCYGVESGGDPDHIPELTYEQFLDFHRKYYHPSNSYIYVYGNVDMDRILDWLDSEYLSEYDLDEVDSEIKIEKPFEKMKEMRVEYPISETEDVEENTYLSYNFVIGDILDRELYLAMQILEYAIISMPGAPVKQALLDAGIGKNADGHYNNFIRQPYFNFTVKSADESKKDEFVKIIRDTLERLVKEGVDKKSLLAAINNYEFQYRENDYGPYPKGLMYSFEVFDSWLYDDANPFRHLNQDTLFDFLREKMDTGYFEKLIEKYFLNNTHCSVVTIVPVKGLMDKKDKELKEKLQTLKNSLSDKELEEIINNTKHLKEYQETPSTKEQLDTIPVLKREDLSREVEPYYNTVLNKNGVTILQHDIFTNKIAYFNFIFDVSDIKRELIPYLTILKYVLGYTDTDKYSYSELSNVIGIETGGIYEDVTIYKDSINPDKFSTKYEIKGKVLFDKIDKGLDIINEIIFNTSFDNEKRIYEILCESKSGLQTSILKSADTIAAIRNTSYISKSGMTGDCIRGIEFYKFLEDIVKNFDSKKEEFISRLKEVYGYIFRKNNLIISYTANNEGYKYFDEISGEIIEKLERNDNNTLDQSGLSELVPQVKNEGFKTSSQVSYVTRGGNYKNKGYKYDATFRVLKTILNSEYLWKNIREQGGAYGCNCYFGESGDIYLTSYRDPNVSRTKNVFDETYKYVENFDTDERNMTKYVIGTISGMDTPLTANAKGNRSTSAYISRQDINRVKEDRLKVLEADAAKIRALAPLVKEITSSDNICVIGNEAKIEEDKELFKTVCNLFE